MAGSALCLPEEHNVASKLNPAEQNIAKPGGSRRSFLVKLGIGAAALAFVVGSLSAMRGGGSNSGASSARNQEFPGEDSIFHPAADPRQDPRRINQG